MIYNLIAMTAIAMRNYILTERERKMLLKFVETGEKSYTFESLKKRIIDNKDQLQQDIELIEIALKIWEKG
jgi:hypothetical protein